MRSLCTGVLQHLNLTSAGPSPPPPRPHPPPPPPPSPVMISGCGRRRRREIPWRATTTRRPAINGRRRLRLQPTQSSRTTYDRRRPASVSPGRASSDSTTPPRSTISAHDAARLWRTQGHLPWREGSLRGSNRTKTFERTVLTAAHASLRQRTVKLRSLDLLSLDSSTCSVTLDSFTLYSPPPPTRLLRETKLANAQYSVL